jgi:hypothetical protein
MMLTTGFSQSQFQEPLTIVSTQSCRIQKITANNKLKRIAASSSITSTISDAWMILCMNFQDQCWKMNLTSLTNFYASLAPALKR